MGVGWWRGLQKTALLTSGSFLHIFGSVISLQMATSAPPLGLKEGEVEDRVH